MPPQFEPLVVGLLDQVVRNLQHLSFITLAAPSADLRVQAAERYNEILMAYEPLGRAVREYLTTGPSANTNNPS